MAFTEDLDLFLSTAEFAVPVVAGAYGSLGLEAPEPDSMIPFDNLTEEIVVGWVKDKFGDEKVAEIETALQAQLDEKHAPTKQAGVPWS